MATQSLSRATPLADSSCENADRNKLCSAFSRIASIISSTNPGVVNFLTECIQSVGESEVSSCIQWIITNKGHDGLVSQADVSAAPTLSERITQSESEETYKDPELYFAGLGLHTSDLVHAAQKVITQDSDDLVNFRKLYDSELKGLIGRFWNLAQPTGSDNRISQVVLSLKSSQISHKVRDRILKCILSKLIDDEEQEQRKNGTSKSEQYRFLARKATVPASYGKDAISWEKKVARLDRAGGVWRKFEPGCLIGLGKVTIDSKIERFNNAELEGFISWLKDGPDYKTWEGLSGLAESLEEAYFTRDGSTYSSSPQPDTMSSINITSVKGRGTKRRPTSRLMEKRKRTRENEENQPQGNHSVVGNNNSSPAPQPFRQDVSEPSPSCLSHTSQQVISSSPGALLNDGAESTLVGSMGQNSSPHEQLTMVNEATAQHSQPFEPCENPAGWQTPRSEDTQSTPHIIADEDDPIFSMTNAASVLSSLAMANGNDELRIAGSTVDSNHSPAPQPFDEVGLHHSNIAGGTRPKTGYNYALCVHNVTTDARSTHCSLGFIGQVSETNTPQVQNFTSIDDIVGVESTITTEHLSPQQGQRMEGCQGAFNHFQQSLDSTSTVEMISVGSTFSASGNGEQDVAVTPPSAMMDLTGEGEAESWDLARLWGP